MPDEIKTTATEAETTTNTTETTAPATSSQEPAGTSQQLSPRHLRSGTILPSNTYIMELLILFLITVIHTSKSIEQPYVIKPLNNTGVIFENLGELWIYHKTWNIFTEIDLVELQTQLKIADYTEHLSSSLCSNDKSTTSTCQRQHQHVHAVIEQIRRRTLIIQELIPKTKQKRSVFDGVGNALHYLFEIMDHSNEQEIYSKLNELKTEENSLLELEKQQISVVNAAFKQIQQPLSALMTRQQQTAYQINYLQNVTDQLTRNQLRQEIMSNIMLYILEIEIRQQTLLDVIFAANNHKIHPLLISPNTLTNVYQKSNSLCQTCL